MKHKHYDCIVAWADGAKIETSEDGLVWSHVQHPRWYEDMQYRIEQSPVIEVVYYFQQFNFDDYHAFDCEPKLKKWDLKHYYCFICD